MGGEVQEGDAKRRTVLRRRQGSVWNRLYNEEEVQNQFAVSGELYLRSAKIGYLVADSYEKDI